MKPVDAPPIRLSSGHCCVCEGTTCNHIGIILCVSHKEAENGATTASGGGTAGAP